GTFHITKPPSSGGIVNHQTVIEQLLYEIGDPSDYLTPDVRANFTTLAVDEADEGVRVTGATGRAPTDSYKVSVPYRDGFMASGTLGVYDSDEHKAKACGNLILARAEAAMGRLARSHIEVLGESSDGDPKMVALRVAVHDPSRERVERFCRE